MIDFTSLALTAWQLGGFATEGPIAGTGCRVCVSKPGRRPRAAAADGVLRQCLRTWDAACRAGRSNPGSGTHEALMQVDGGLYQRLYLLQHLAA